MKRALHTPEATGGVERFLVMLLSKMKEYREFEHCLICSYSYDRQRFDGLVRSFEFVPCLHNELNPINDIGNMMTVRHFIRSGMTLVRENYNAERSAREHVKLFARMI